jgi:hypothetical protein
MKRKIIVFSFLVLSLVFSLGAGRADALGQSQPGKPQAALGASFTYQGYLRTSAGNPVNATCDFTFRLYDQSTGGTKVGSDSLAMGVVVTNGSFTSLVNTANEFGGTAFTGQSRWLQVDVQCPGDSSPTTLTPRQEMTAVPYALYSLSASNADLLDGQHASAFASAGLNHWGASWSGSGTGLTLSGDTGLSGTGNQYGVYGASASSSGRGVYGYASASSGITSGVYGESASTAGSGVYGQGLKVGVQGYASSTTGRTFGVYGESASTDGWAVSGYATANSGTTYGVVGESQSTSGAGVRGNATNLNGTTYGVYGQSDSGNGYGVYGYNSAGSSSAYGVYGKSDSFAGTGVYGYATATGGYAYGVYGLSKSSEGAGVVGESTSTAYYSYSFGVIGKAASTLGVGVLGQATSEDGGSVGVKGQSFSTYGIGVNGWANYIGVSGSANGTEGYGLYGYADSSSGTTYGVYGKADSTDGYGVYGEAPFEGVFGAATGTTGYGVYGFGHSAGLFGSGTEIGVKGYISLQQGTTYGVMGQSDSTDGYGVYGFSSNNSGTTYGVYGESLSSAGYGMYGYAYAGSGTTYGVYGKSNSPDGFGGFFTSPGVGLYALGGGLGNTKASLRSTNYGGGIASYFQAAGSYPTSEFDQNGTGKVLDLQNGGDVDGNGGGDFIAGYSKDSSFDMQFRITSSGQGRSDIGWTTPAEDFAELLSAVDGLQPGDLLVIGPDGKLTLSTQPYQASLAGVYSTQPGFLGGQPVQGTVDGTVPLALVGVVPVKVSAENGAIHPGDCLTASSTPGHAMKANPITVNGITFYPSGVILGKALESLDSGTGVILVLVTLQ